MMPRGGQIETTVEFTPDGYRVRVDLQRPRSAGASITVTVEATGDVQPPDKRNDPAHIGVLLWAAERLQEMIDGPERFPLWLPQPDAAGPS